MISRCSQPKELIWYFLKRKIYSFCLVSGWTKTSLAHFFGISFILVQMVKIRGKNLIVLPSAQKSLSTMAYAQRRMMQTLSRIVRIPVMTTPPVLEKQRQHLSGHWGHPPPPQRPPEPLLGGPPPQPHIFLSLFNTDFLHTFICLLMSADNNRALETFLRQ